MKIQNSEDRIVFDAQKKILGRVASIAAKNLLEGKKVVIINAGEAVITGRRNFLIKKYKTRMSLQNKANPEHSPYWSKRPDMLVKRVIRGMLPYRRPRGKVAYKNLLVFTEVPEQFANVKTVEIKGNDIRRMYSNTITVKELSGLLGYEKS